MLQQQGFAPGPLSTPHTQHLCAFAPPVWELASRSALLPSIPIRRFVACHPCGPPVSSLGSAVTCLPSRGHCLQSQPLGGGGACLCSGGGRRPVSSSRGRCLVSCSHSRDSSAEFTVGEVGPPSTSQGKAPKRVKISRRKFLLHVCRDTPVFPVGRSRVLSLEFGSQSYFTVLSVVVLS